MWCVALKNVFGGIYWISYVSRLLMTYILSIQTFTTFVQGEINKIIQISGVEERHLVVRFNNALSTRGRLEREWLSGLHKVSWQIINFLGKLLNRLQRWSFFYNDGMVMFFFQGTIVIDGFSMVVPSLDHHHWMFFFRSTIDINGFSMVFPNSGAMVSDGFDLEKDLQMRVFLFEI